MDIVDITIDITDIINIADIANWIFINIIVKTGRHI